MRIRIYQLDSDKWSWIWVLSPLWISAVIVIVVFSVILIGGRIKTGKW